MLWGSRIRIDTTMGELIIAAKYADRGGDEECARMWVKVAINRIREILDTDERTINRVKRE